MFENSEIDHLLNFVGYGDKNADTWFLGMEEGGGGEESLRARLGFSQFEDNYEAHKKLGILKFHEGKRSIQRTWRGMSVLSLMLDDKPFDTEAVRQHQAELLGRAGSNTLLCELMPLPKASIGSWGYEKLIPQFASRESYYKTVMPGRITLLQALYAEHRPSVVVAYGKAFWSSYKQVFRDVTFTQDDGFEIGRTEQGVIVLCGHFTARTMNGKLPGLAAKIKAYMQR
ncbi:MAG: hypothetical protein CL578_23815 [Alteromonadaceae bacterium]|uniref:hypothetical protein n=1 Tax=Paraglaciecola chathamensis TaxID=368405 RepID=UPI000C5EA02D|nr:hypothetical protein [Paraglaciecola agarilytica]MBN28047.1 hypothetical protein [Alteromonadaceae bacterium]|tara:strand:+ start:49643 stop:50326 length:684 start_codon:yes stop_codon:yes gene_type:complete